MTASILQLADLTGIPVIDDQHQEIIALVDTLGKMSASSDRQAIGRQIDRILSLTLAHFEFEEELMEESSYPFLKVHKRLHDHFTHRLLTYTHRFYGGEDIVEELAPFLSNWLHNHFSQEDKDYSPRILAEMQGSANKTSTKGKGWLSRKLYKFT